MGEPNRRDDQLTTADFASRPANREDSEATTAREDERRRTEKPQLVRSEGSGERTETANAAAANDAGSATPLFPESEISDLRARWNNIQAEFVDEPRRSVEQADQLVATAMQKLADGFANERASLEKQWDSGDSVSTEDLRLALQRYRTFFGRLLNAA
jgi:molecular chaperone GrpE (heat shock protein)